MFKKLINKIKKNNGSVSIAIAIAAPIILLVLFLGIDIIRYSNAKADMQRRLDSATLGVVTNAMPSAEHGDYLNASGEIIHIEYDEEGNVEHIINKGVACEIKDDYFMKAYEQLSKDTNQSYTIGEDGLPIYESFKVVNISTEEQKENGIVRIQATGIASDFMSNSLLPFVMRFSFALDSYSVCNSGAYIPEDVDPSTKYKIYFDANGGSLDADNPMEYTTMDTFTLPVPTRDRYIFTGWHEVEDLSDTAIYKIFAGEIGDKFLYASWEIDPLYSTEYVIRYISSTNKSLGSETKYGALGEEILVSPKEFVGYISPTAQKIVLNKENNVVEFIYEPIKYSIVYHVGEGKLSKDYVKEYTIETETFGLPIPVLDDSEFLAWYSDEEYSKIAPSTINQGSTGNIEVWAKYDNEIFVKVKFVTHYDSDGIKWPTETFPVIPEQIIKHPKGFVEKIEKPSVMGYIYPDNMTITWDKDKTVTFECIPGWYWSILDDKETLIISNNKMEGYATGIVEKYKKYTATPFIAGPYTNVKKIVVGQQYDKDFIDPVHMSFWFSGFEAAKEYDFKNLITDKLLDLKQSFAYNYALPNISVSNWNVSKVTDMNSTFFNCLSLKTLDLSSWDTSNVSEFQYFIGAAYNQSMPYKYYINNEDAKPHSGIENFVIGEKWSTSAATILQSMFINCASLKEIPNIEDWDVSNVKYIQNIFNNCQNIKALDLSKWQLTSLEDDEFIIKNLPTEASLYGMFENCHNLKTLKLGTVTIPEGSLLTTTFANCYELTELDLSKVLLAGDVNHNFDSSATIPCLSQSKKLEKISISKTISNKIEYFLANPDKNYIPTTDEYWHDINDMVKRYKVADIPKNIAGTYIAPRDKYYFNAINLTPKYGTVNRFRTAEKEILPDGTRKYINFSNEINEYYFSQEELFYVQILPKPGYKLKSVKFYDIYTDELITSTVQETLDIENRANGFAWVVDSLDERVEIEFAPDYKVGDLVDLTPEGLIPTEIIEEDTYRIVSINGNNIKLFAMSNHGESEYTEDETNNAYSDSILDNYASQFYDELDTKIQKAIVEETFTSHSYTFEIYVGPDEEWTFTTSKPTSEVELTRKVHAPDLGEMEAYMGGTYTSMDMQREFNIGSRDMIWLSSPAADQIEAVWVALTWGKELGYVAPAVTYLECDFRPVLTVDISKF